MSTHTVRQFSGCFTVGDIEFAGEGWEDDKKRAQEYADFLNLPESEQTQNRFFALTEIKNQVEAQKIHPYRSTEHKQAYKRICELAFNVPSARHLYKTQDY